MAVIEGLVPRTVARGHEAPRAGRRVIRAANVSEAAVLGCLHRSLARDTFAFEDCLGSDPRATSSIVLVCEVSEAIAGYLCLGDPLLMSDAPESPASGTVSTRWELRAIGVAPQFRRSSVATDLWRVALGSVPAAVVEITGDVRADRVSAAAWLRTRGFALDRRAGSTTAARAVGLWPGDGLQPSDVFQPSNVFRPSGAREAHFAADVAALRANLESATNASTVLAAAHHVTQRTATICTAI